MLIEINPYHRIQKTSAPFIMQYKNNVCYRKTTNRNKKNKINKNFM